jgi:hypothetical protein
MLGRDVRQTTPQRRQELTMSEHLFALPSDSFAVTSDDCYTPRWVFDAMDLHFDLDVAAPLGGPWHVPTERYYTAEDDGLSQQWEGLVWCNPPFSGFRPWAEAWAQHDRAVLVGLMISSSWLGETLARAEVVCVLPRLRRFLSPNGKGPDFRQVPFVAFRGVGTEPAERLATADPYGAALYGGSIA